MQGGPSLALPLHSVSSRLVSLDLSHCSDLPAAFVTRHLPSATPGLQVQRLRTSKQQTPTNKKQQQRLRTAAVTHVLAAFN